MTCFKTMLPSALALTNWPPVSLGVDSIRLRPRSRATRPRMMGLDTSDSLSQIFPFRLHHRDDLAFQRTLQWMQRPRRWHRQRCILSKIAAALPTRKINYSTCCIRLPCTCSGKPSCHVGHNSKETTERLLRSQVPPHHTHPYSHTYPTTHTK